LAALTADQVTELLAELAPPIGSPGEKRKAAPGGGDDEVRRHVGASAWAGGRNGAMRTRLLGVLDRAADELAKEHGNRNDMLAQKTVGLAEHASFYPGLLGKEEVRAALHAPCERNGYIDSTEPGDGEEGFRKTFEYNWTKGFASPQPLRERIASGGRAKMKDGAEKPGGEEKPHASAAAGKSGETGEEPLVLHEDALYGLAGDVVQMILPHTEAAAVGLLLSFHAMFGSAIGRGPHFRVDGADLHANIEALLVGSTSAGKKGTATGNIRKVFRYAAPDWVHDCISNGGLASGEGIIHRVRDPRYEEDEKGTHKLVDPGVLDKRLLVFESEFGSVLAVMTRQGNTLGPILRSISDDGNLDNMSKTHPERATGAHVSILGHITPEELVAKLTSVDMVNGFANRFMLAHVQRSQSEAARLMGTSKSWAGWSASPWREPPPSGA
jgi:hypothetical protein